MAERLQVDPIPLRLLTRDLEDVDRILLIDGLVDSPRLSRTQILDRLEQLRLRIEQINDQYRRIAAGAREQMEQGRLTTALYDLERALKLSGSEGEPQDNEGISLQKQLESVRVLREGIHTASRRNLELAELYETLRQQPSSLTDRLSCLEQRAAELRFLRDNGPKVSAAHYESELEDIRLNRLEELSADADLRLEAMSDPERQVGLARDMLHELAPHLVPGAARHVERHAARQRQWEAHLGRAEARLTARAVAVRQRARLAKIRLAAVGIAGILVMAVAVHFLRPAAAADTLVKELAVARTAAAIQGLAEETRDPAVRAPLLRLAEATRLKQVVADDAASAVRLEGVLREIEAALAQMGSEREGLVEVVRRRLAELRGR
jgi:hypothetical protein